MNETAARAASTRPGTTLKADAFLWRSTRSCDWLVAAYRPLVGSSYDRMRIGSLGRPAVKKTSMGQTSGGGL